MHPLKVRQFFHRSSHRVVNCEWDQQHQAWVCSSDRHNRFNLCAASMGPIYASLKGAGYLELKGYDRNDHNP